MAEVNHRSSPSNYKDRLLEVNTRKQLGGLDGYFNWLSLWCRGESLFPSPRESVNFAVSCGNKISSSQYERSSHDAVILELEGTWVIIWPGCLQTWFYIALGISVQLSKRPGGIAPTFLIFSINFLLVSFHGNQEFWFPFLQSSDFNHLIKGPKEERHLVS